MFVASACQTTTGGTFAADAEAGVCGEGGLPPPPEACLDTIAAVSRAKARCGGDYDASYRQLVNTVAGDGAAGDCTNVTGVRDENELCFECIPTLETIPCADIQGDKLPYSCQLQLMRNP